MLAAEAPRSLIFEFAGRVGTPTLAPACSLGSLVEGAPVAACLWPKPVALGATRGEGVGVTRPTVGAVGPLPGDEPATVGFVGITLFGLEDELADGAERWLA